MSQPLIEEPAPGPPASRPGFGLPLGILACKLGGDITVGGAAQLFFGIDIPAWGMCAVTAAGWIPVLALVAVLVPADMRQLPWRSTRDYRALPVMLVGATVVAVAVVLPFFLQDVTTPLQDAIRTDVDRFAIAAYALLIAPLAEEVFFRGFLYAALERTVGAWMSVLLVGLVFGVFHGLQYAGVPAALLAVTLMGLATTWVRMTTGGLLPCVVLHVVYNVAGVCILLLAS